MRADAVTAMDVCVVAGQLGRRPRPMSAVAAHCPHGFPAAVEMLPVDDHGRPFPTLYYLTCPTAVTAIGALENAGGVDRLQRATDADERLRAEAVQEPSAGLLGLSVGTPVLRIERVARTFDQRPAEFRISTVDSRDFDYVSQLRGESRGPV